MSQSEYLVHRVAQGLGVDATKPPKTRKESFEDIVQIQRPKRPHGDYGKILIDGMAAGGFGGRLEVCRTAQGCPDVSFPRNSIPVVNQRGRARLEGLGLENLAFVECPVKFVVNLDWTAWDLAAEQLPEYPAEGEPENFIMGLPPRSDLLELVGPLWAVSSSERGRLAKEEQEDSDPYAEIEAVRKMLAERSTMTIWCHSELGFGGLFVGRDAAKAMTQEFGNEIAFGPWTTRISIHR